MASKYRYEIDEPVWIHWSNRELPVRAWVVNRDWKGGGFAFPNGFPMYTVLTEEGDEVPSMVERLMSKRRVND